MEHELEKLTDLKEEKEECIRRVINAVEDFERLASMATTTLKETLIRLGSEEEDSGDRAQRFEAQLLRLRELQGITRTLIYPMTTSAWVEKQEHSGEFALNK